MEIKWIAIAVAISLSSISLGMAYSKAEYYKCQTINNILNFGSKPQKGWGQELFFRDGLVFKKISYGFLLSLLDESKLEETIQFNFWWSSRKRKDDYRFVFGENH